MIAVTYRPVEGSANTWGVWVKVAVKPRLIRPFDGQAPRYPEDLLLVGTVQHREDDVWVPNLRPGHNYSPYSEQRFANRSDAAAWILLHGEFAKEKSSNGELTKKRRGIPKRITQGTTSCNGVNARLTQTDISAAPN